MRPPFKKGFLKSGFFKWPEREITKSQCLGCKQEIDTYVNGKKRLRCSTCARKRRLALTAIWKKRAKSQKIKSQKVG